MIETFYPSMLGNLLVSPRVPGPRPSRRPEASVFSRFEGAFSSGLRLEVRRREGPSALFFSVAIT